MDRIPGRLRERVPVGGGGERGRGERGEGGGEGGEEGSGEEGIEQGGEEGEVPHRVPVEGGGEVPSRVVEELAVVEGGGEVLLGDALPPLESAAPSTDAVSGVLLPPSEADPDTPVAASSSEVPP